MAAMVARGSSPLASSISIQEKGSRNKRKFRADPPIADPSLISPSIQTGCLNYELFPMDKTQETSTPEHQPGMCEFCMNPAFSPQRDDLELEQFHEADWNDKGEAQLEETLISNLDMIFMTAVKSIMSYGYTEEIATTAVLHGGLCFGCKDIVANIVDKALVFLGSGQDVNSLLSETVGEELRKMERSALSEMVNVLRECRPFLSRGDAMWLLLMSDMNVSIACTADCNPSSGTESEVSVTLSSNPSTIASSQTMSELSSSGSSKSSLMLPYPQNTAEPEIPGVVGIPSLPSGRFSAAASVQNPVSPLSSAKDNPIASLSCVIDEFSSSICMSAVSQEGKPSGSKKGHSDSLKRESVLRQKSVHFEKSYRMLGTKAVMRASKHNGFGGFLLDKKSKAVSDSNAKNMKNSFTKLNKAVVPDSSSQANPSITLSLSGDGPMSMTNHAAAPLKVANTELSLSLPYITSSGGCGGDGVVEAGFSSAKAYGNWGAPLDRTDELLHRLVPRVKELEAQLQEWSDWAQQKVMQAARRLGKEKPELHILRQEKEEVARLKKEKQSLEENTRKKLAEMEIALSKASSQVEKANAEARDLEYRNAALRKEMEAAKLRAAESAASCQEVSQREMKTLKKIQSWERQKVLLQEELATEKKKFSQLQQKFGQAKENYDQIKAKWKQEEKAKDEALIQSNSARKEREQIEILGRSKENAIKLKAETELQRYKDDIRKLEQQIARLRQKTDSSKIAALKWGEKESNGNVGSKLFLELEEVEEVQRERECVMCLTEEMTVVFLPCAHQVVCVDCNELHEKQGMKDCPSCRTPIEKRICVRSADS